MKMMKKFAFLIAVAAMGFTACSKDEGAEVNNESSFKLTIEASADDTRSSFGDKGENGYLSNWSGTENVWFYMGEGATGVKATPAAAGLLTSFDVTFTGTAPESGVIYALSPVGDNDSTPKKGGFTSSSLTASYANSWVIIPAEQTPLAASCDESVHLLAATKEFTGSIESPLKMQFNHVAAYGKMAITNFTPAIASVTITSPVAIVGNSCKYFYKTGELNAADGKTLTLDAANVENNTFWFGCAPAELTSGVMTVAVTDTEGKRYVKDITLTADKGIKFIQGRVAAFSVNMAGIEEPEKGLDLPFVETFNTVKYTGSFTDLSVSDFANFSTFSKVRSYTEAGAVVLGTSSAAGAMTTVDLNLSEEFTIVVRAKQYGSDGAKVRVTINGTNYDAKEITSDYKDYSFTIPAVGLCEPITITSTTKKRIWIDNINVVNGVVINDPEISAKTDAVSNYSNTETGTTATLNGTYDAMYLTDENVVAVGFEYKESTAEEWISVDAAVANSYSYELTELTTDTEYVVRAWASLDNGTTKVYGSEVTFTPTKAAEINPGDDIVYMWTVPWSTTKNDAKSDDNNLGATLGIYKANGSFNGGSWTNTTNKSYFSCSTGYGFRCTIPTTNLSAGQNVTVSTEVFGWKSNAYIARTFNVVYWTNNNTTKATVTSVSASAGSNVAINTSFELTSEYIDGATSLFVEIVPTAAGNSGIENNLTITIE